MIARLRVGVILALLLTAAESAGAASETAVVERATRLLEEIASDPASGIPAEHLREAEGILIMPGIVETQLGVGGSTGRGVFLPREEHGGWGDPELVGSASVNVGAEAGREVTDMVVIYRTRKAADKHGAQSLALGLSFTYHGSRKPSNKFSGPGGDDKAKKDILTYKRHRGILVGARFLGERQWAFAPSVAKAPPKADPKAGGEPGAKEATPAGPPPGAAARPAQDRPEVGRLKAVLAAMTARPAAPVAGTMDPKVRLAGGAKPPAGTAATPR